MPEKNASSLLAWMTAAGQADWECWPPEIIASASGMTALPGYITYWIVLSTHTVGFGGRKYRYVSRTPSYSLSLSLYTRPQTHRKLCRECQCFLRAPARRETFTQVDMLDHQDWHAHARARIRTHIFPVFIPAGGWAVDKLSWQPPPHLVFPLHPVLFFRLLCPLFPVQLPVPLLSLRCSL